MTWDLMRNSMESKILLSGIFLKEIYKYCIKNMGKFVQYILLKQGKINGFLMLGFYDHIIQKK